MDSAVELHLTDDGSALYGTDCNGNCIYVQIVSDQGNLVQTSLLQNGPTAFPVAEPTSEALNSNTDAPEEIVEFEVSSINECEKFVPKKKPRHEQLWAKNRKKSITQ